MPYLIIKKDRAEALVKLHKLQHNKHLRTPVTHWLVNNPDWEQGPMLTSTQVRDQLDWSKWRIYNALNKGFLVALPLRGPKELPKYPKGLIDYLSSLRGPVSRFLLPPEYLEECEALYQQVKQMNLIGKKAMIRDGLFTEL